ncbi:MAG: hypothetical protein LBG58_00615 [Planctomycetaceae bacterium]|jgi:hypothetical protein|nr:hypothetical protein [Planctomycetaceae bacterium]
MKNELKTEITIQTPPQNTVKQHQYKKWMLNLIAVMTGFLVICRVLGILDILAQRELRKPGDALPKLFLYRWKNKVTTQIAQLDSRAANDPLNGPTRDLETLFPNLVDDHLPYIIANYFKIFIRQSCLSNFETHSQMQPLIITPNLLTKLERPFVVCLGGSTTDPFLLICKKDTEGKPTTKFFNSSQIRIKELGSTLFANGTWSE